MKNNSKKLINSQLLISVVIPTHNDGVFECLQALSKQSLSKKKYEVIIIDNCSTDSTIKKIVSKFSFAKYLREDRKGAYFARNLGWKNSKAPIIAFTDADCQPDRTWLKEIVNFFKNKKEVAMGGSIIKIKPKNWIEKNTRHLADSQTKFRYKPYLPNYPYVVAANMAFRKKILKELNGFITTYISGGDGDFCWRLKDKGYKLKLIQKAKVFHPCRDSIRGYYKQNYNYGVGHPLQFKKWYPHNPKIFLDTENLKNLITNFLFLPIGMILFMFWLDKKEKLYKAFLEVIRSSALILGRIRGSCKYRVIYI